MLNGKSVSISSKKGLRGSIYTILKDRRYPMEITSTLNHHKAKIHRLHSKRFRSIIIDTHEATLLNYKISPISISYK